MQKWTTFVFVRTCMRPVWLHSSFHLEPDFRGFWGVHLQVSALLRMRQNGGALCGAQWSLVLYGILVYRCMILLFETQICCSVTLVLSGAWIKSYQDWTGRKWDRVKILVKFASVQTSPSDESPNSKVECGSIQLFVGFTKRDEDGTLEPRTRISVSSHNHVGVQGQI